MARVDLPPAGVDFPVAFGGSEGSSFGARAPGRHGAELYIRCRPPTPPQAEPARRFRRAVEPAGRNVACEACAPLAPARKQGVKPAPDPAMAGSGGLRLGETSAKPSGAVALGPFTLLKARLRPENILNYFNILNPFSRVKISPSRRRRGFGERLSQRSQRMRSSAASRVTPSSRIEKSADPSPLTSPCSSPPANLSSPAWSPKDAPPI